MRTPVRACRKIVNTLLAAGFLVLVSPRVFSDAEDSPGWTSDFLPSEPWKENPGELPAYPEQGNLLEVNINASHQQYRLYIDTQSIRPGDDYVVRYTVVLVSSSGVWNVSNEGLHCGHRKFRRYAYGYQGQWRELENSPWQPVSGQGVNGYRKLFYNHYMCDQIEPYGSAREIIGKFRSPGIQIDD